MLSSPARRSALAVWSCRAPVAVRPITPWTSPPDAGSGAPRRDEPPVAIDAETPGAISAGPLSAAHQRYGVASALRGRNRRVAPESTGSRVEWIPRSTRRACRGATLVRPALRNGTPVATLLPSRSTFVKKKKKKKTKKNQSRPGGVRRRDSAASRAVRLRRRTLGWTPAHPPRRIGEGLVTPIYGRPNTPTRAARSRTGSARDHRGGRTERAAQAGWHGRRRTQCNTGVGSRSPGDQVLPLHLHPARQDVPGEVRLLRAMAPKSSAPLPRYRRTIPRTMS